MNELQIFENSEFGSENFKIIHGYDNLYCVNQYGKVISPSYVDKSGKLRKQKELSVVKRGKGYCCVGLMKNGKQEHISLHRLVAEAFIPNPLELPQVNHKDGNKENNHVSNLEWCTNQENIIHAFKKGLKIPTCHVGEKNTKAKLNDNIIRYIRNSNESAKELSNRFGVSKSAIYKVREAVRWSHI